MPIVHFVKQHVSVHCPAGTNLRELARANGIDLYVFPNNIANCRGFGLCGTCRVEVSDPRALSTRTPADEAKTGWQGPRHRLACQSNVLADVEVITNPRKILGWTNHPTYQWMQTQK